MQYDNTEIQKLRDCVLVTLIATNIAIGGAVVGVMLYLNNQTLVMLQHWKP
jgi:hypothetical protein